MKKFFNFVFVVVIWVTFVFSPAITVSADQGNGNGNGNPCPDNPGPSHFCAKNPSDQSWAKPSCSALDTFVGKEWALTFTENCNEISPEQTPVPTIAPTVIPTAVPTPVVTPESATTQVALAQVTSRFCFANETILATGRVADSDFAGSRIILLSENKPVNLTGSRENEYYTDLVISSDGCEALAAYFDAGNPQSDIVRIGFFRNAGQIQARVLENITNTKYESEWSPEYGPSGSIFFNRAFTGGRVAFMKTIGEEKVVGANVKQFAYDEKRNQTAVLLDSGEIRWLIGGFIADTFEYNSIVWVEKALWGIDKKGQLMKDLALGSTPTKENFFRDYLVLAFDKSRVIAWDNAWNLNLFRKNDTAYEQEKRLDTTGYNLYRRSVVLWSPEK